MAAVNDVPLLVDKKGGSYAAIAPKLEPGKFNKWKKRMLCYLVGMEPYCLKCIKDGPFQPKITDGDAKPKSQWTLDERMVVVQDERLKSIIMSCLPDDIIESVISCVLAKETWTDLVYSFEDKEEVSDDEEVTQVKVLMALVDDELTVGKSYARNGEWVDITIRKGGFTMISGDYTLTFQPHFPRERPSLGIVGIKSLLEVTTAKLTGNQQVVSELVALRNFVKKKLLLHSRSVCYKEMDHDSAHMVAASKVPMLKQ
ncbi:hypothetical protein Tco_0707569 [Tanacetum coccineum]|uniref:Retrovirus-related Pol polyprotein from transposon TNT 1-94 n=1 Tax=Tanacetum coccineum TaxID=301880 RepID=A0ABQ4YAN7_9ASTR